MKPTHRVTVIGILGGIASGKSQVALQFESLGAVRIDGDELGHLVLREPEVQTALVERWGSGILDAQAQIDRRAVGRIVFGATAEAAAELAFLEGVTHPRIAARLNDTIAAAARRGATVVVIDAAVMDKAGWDQACDQLVFVDVAREERLRRAMGRGWTADEFMRREAAQSPLARKRQRANTIIDNSGPLEETFVQVKRFWSNLTARQASESRVQAEQDGPSPTLPGEDSNR